MIYCDPYLDSDWAEAILNPETNHLLYLTDAEMSIRKTQETQKSKSNARRNTGKNAERHRGHQEAA